MYGGNLNYWNQGNVRLNAILHELDRHRAACMIVYGILAA